MLQEDLRRAPDEKIDDLRKKLNEEIEKKGFNLAAPSVMEISVELDYCIAEHYQGT